MNRRKLFSLLASTPFIGAMIAKPKLSSGPEILKSFDARDWARDFVAHAKALPGLATDEETMTTWFANALMRGYDERWREVKSEDITAAVAQGWTTDKNRFTPMDCDLASAIVENIQQLFNVR